jgi:hypothetical protein
MQAAKFLLCCGKCRLQYVPESGCCQCLIIEAFMSEPNVLSFDWALWFQWIMATTLGWVLGRFLLPNLAFAMIGIAMGILQWFILQHHIRKAWQWIFATALGWLLGSILLFSVVPTDLDFVAGVVMGLTTGTAQWVILRREFFWSGWWIVINVVAWTTGMALLPGLLLTGVIAGVITGVAIGLLLQNPKPPLSPEET